MLKTKIVYVSLKERERSVRAIDAAAQAIKSGGVIVFPTETAYGIGVDATNAVAVKKIFELKKRDSSKPIPVIVSDLRMAKEYAEVNELAEHLANAFMPGPITLVVEKKAGIPSELSSSGLAFRIPSNPFARALTAEAGVPITATSANLSGNTPLYNANEVMKEFSGKVNIIMNAGNLPGLQPSTVLDTRTTPPTLVREGPISWNEILSEMREFEEKKLHASENF